METLPEIAVNPGDVMLADRELDSRYYDGLFVTLWWVQQTLATYVTIEDHKGIAEDGSVIIQRIEVPDGTSSNEVFNHPFAFLNSEASHGRQD